MNTKIIIYDDSCPMCSAYTNAFVRAGLIEKEGRKNFSNVNPVLLEKIDTRRSVNEIPLIDTATNQVWYGIDALLELLQQKIPFAKSLGNIKPLRWALQKFYKFISYNRRVIVASHQQGNGFDCTPDFNVPYRIMFMVVFLCFNTMMLFPLHRYVLSESLFKNNSIEQLQLAHISLVILNITIAIFIKKKDGLEYLGQVNMLALLVILLSFPLMLINKYATFNNVDFNSFYLGALSIFTAREYSRRMKFIQLIQTHRLIVLINIVSVAAFVLYLIY